MVTMSVGSPLHWTLGLSLKGINPKEGLLARSVEQLLVHVSISLQPIPRGLGYRQATPILTCFHKRNGVYSTIVVFIFGILPGDCSSLKVPRGRTLKPEGETE
jgi:hypothetical protein